LSFVVCVLLFFLFVFPAAGRCLCVGVFLSLDVASVRESKGLLGRLLNFVS
jgi:hypothetical protein